MLARTIFSLLRFLCLPGICLLPTLTSLLSRFHALHRHRYRHHPLLQVLSDAIQGAVARGLPIDNLTSSKRDYADR